LLRSYRARFSIVHIGEPPANQAVPLESQTIHSNQDVSGQTLIDEELVKGINFIREGQFDEVDGDPTLKLVGEVKAVNIQAIGRGKTIPKAISQENILAAFLNQEDIGQPKEWVFAGISQPRLWLPLFYFVKLSGLTTEEVIAEVAKIATSQKGKRQNVVERMSGKKSAYTKTLTQKARAFSAQIENGVLEVPKSLAEIAAFAQGVTGVIKTAATLHDLLKALETCRAIAVATDDGNSLGTVFKAACRVDELFFKP
jgi:hypothetical protein